MIGRVSSRAFALVGATALVALVGCGSSGDKENGQSTTVAGSAQPSHVQVIRQWADELRAGNVADASERFSVPSVVQNGTAPLTLTARSQVEAFNQSLPCGARLTAAVESGRYTIATFKLTERPGPGHCGDGVGEEAKTAFVIENGLITQWRRVVDAGAPPADSGPVV
jgi:hypothetical protein